MLKNIHISGEALQETKTRKKRTKKGGSYDILKMNEPLRGVESTSSVAASAASSNPATWLKYPPGPVPSSIGGARKVQQQPQQPQPEDTKHFKVELKKYVKKVHLNQKKEPKKVKKPTKKVRKFTLGISTFHKRITRAKKLHKKVKELSLEKLKEKLVKDGLIKSTSKAPECVLRQMASDAEVVSKKAL